MSTWGGADTKGLNDTQISKMVAALDNYIAVVDKHVAISASVSQIESAIKGTATEASVKTMNADITSKCISFIADLNKFKNALTSLKSAYVKQDTGNTVFANVSKSLDNK